MDSMDQTWALLGTAFMGLGGAVAGVVGIALPEGRRLGALFALVVGAGVGVALLGIGPLLSGGEPPSPFMFFVGSAAGFVTVCVASWILWRRSSAERGSSSVDLER